MSTGIDEFVLITYVYEVPLSNNATALLLGAPLTVVVGMTVVLPMMTASRRTFHRVGEFTGHVEIAVLFSTAA